MFTKEVVRNVAVFRLIESEKGDRYYSDSYRFEGEPGYCYQSLIFKEVIKGMVVLDLILTDEFMEPYAFCSQPVLITQSNLFQNAINMEVSDGDTLSFKREIGSGVLIKC